MFASLPHSVRTAAWKGLLVALAVALAVAALAEQRELARQRAELLSGLDSNAAAPLAAEAAERIAHEPDPDRARLAVARLLVAAELDPGEVAPLSFGDPNLDRKASLERLELARRLAARAFAARPAAWQGAMLLGAATYLGWSVDHDRRLFTDAAAWDRPLTHARMLAPGKAEPSRLLVTAYLELWPALSPAKRKLALSLLGRAFEDPSTFQRLIGPWLTVAPDREEAFAVIPPDPDAWAQLLDLLAAGRSWDDYREARRRWVRALLQHLTGELHQAEARLSARDTAGARQILLDILGRASRDTRFVPLVRRSLDLLPPTPSAGRRASNLERWLAWTLDLCLYRDCPLDAEQIDRLAILAGELPRTEEARAALAGRRLPAAELLERRSDGLWREDWGPYFVTKARILLERGDASEAWQALSRTPRAWQERAPYRLTELRVADALGDRATAERAGEELAALRGDRWPPFAWFWSGPQARLEMLTAEPASGLTVDLREVPEGGAAVELRLDGRGLGTLVATSAGRLRTRVEIRSGLHLLELVSLAGGRVLPGAVELIPTPTS